MVWNHLALVLLIYFREVVYGSHSKPRKGMISLLVWAVLLYPMAAESNPVIALFVGKEQVSLEVYLDEAPQDCIGASR